MLEAYVGIVNGLGDGQKASLLEHPNLRPCGLAVMFHLLGRVAADWAKGLVEPSVLKASVGLLHDLLRVLPRETREYCAGAHQQAVHALLKEAHEDEQCQELAHAVQVGLVLLRRRRPLLLILIRMKILMLLIRMLLMRTNPSRARGVQTMIAGR